MEACRRIQHHLWACTQKNGKKGSTGEWGENREMSKDTREKEGKCRREGGADLEKTEEFCFLCGRMNDGPDVGKEGLNAELSRKHNNDTNSRENTVFHVKLMFPHKPLFI